MAWHGMGARRQRHGMQRQDDTTRCVKNKKKRPRHVILTPSHPSPHPPPASHLHPHIPHANISVIVHTPAAQAPCRGLRGRDAFRMRLRMPFGESGGTWMVCGIEHLRMEHEWRGKTRVWHSLDKSARQDASMAHARLWHMHMLATSYLMQQDTHALRHTTSHPPQ